MSGSHWSTQKERAVGYWNVRIMLVLFKLLPVILLRLIAFPVGFFYFLFSKTARGHSRAYLRRVNALRRESRQSAGAENQPNAKKLKSLRHFLAFALALVDKVEAWGGKAPFKRVHFCDDDIDSLISLLESGQGAVLISSHLGNMEFARALAGMNRTGVSREVPVNALVDIKVTAHFNRMLKELNSQSATRLMSVSDLGPDTVILLVQRLAAGDLVVIAGDRTGAGGSGRIIPVSFFDEPAPLPYGPFLLAALLDAPVYSVFALRTRDISLRSHYALHVHKSPLTFDCGRAERNARIRELAHWFASQLQRYCQEHPYQWYNFFDFWKMPEQ